MMWPQEQEVTNQQELENAEHDEHLYATIRGSLYAMDSAACAVQTAADVLRDLHVQSLWYGSGTDDECERVDAAAKVVWAAMQALSEAYRVSDAIYADDASEEAAA